MKGCPQCGRVYSDETFSFCLFDGNRLSDFSNSDLTYILPSPNAFEAVTILSSPSQKHFEEELVFDEIAAEKLTIKIISQYEQYIKFALKVVVKNLAKKRKEIFVEIQAVDDEGFELENYTLSAKLNPAEIKIVSQKYEGSSVAKRLKESAKLLKWNS